MKKNGFAQDHLPSIVINYCIRKYKLSLENVQTIQKFFKEQELSFLIFFRNLNYIGKFKTYFFSYLLYLSSKNWKIEKRVHSNEFEKDIINIINEIELL